MKCVKAMKKNKKENSFTAFETASAGKRSHGIVVLAAAILALLTILGGTVRPLASPSNEESVDAPSEIGGAIAYSQINIPEDKLASLAELDAAIAALDVEISRLDAQIEKHASDESPEMRVSVKSLYDEKARILFEKLSLCSEISDICLDWAQETRDSLAEPIAEYESYYELYKERLATVYEVGFPDLREVFDTSETVMDFIMGKVALDKVRDYDEALADKVTALYAVVENGLGTVKYYLAKSENYAALMESTEEKFYECTDEGSAYLDKIRADKNTYNYFLQYISEQHQKFTKLLGEKVSAESPSVGGSLKYEFPVDSQYFYTDYMGSGHEVRYEWSPVLGKYVSIFHSGIDVHTAGRYTEVRASADGKVIYADYCPIRGYTVALVHSNGVVTVYSGCSSIRAEVGGEVKTGDMIAFTGMSGDSDVFKVTFEIFENGNFIDPDEYVSIPDVSVSDN